MVKKIKTSELIGPALDWAVAKCEGLDPNTDPEVRKQYVGYPGFAEYNGFGYAIKNYSTDWAQGGPIIDREITKLFKNVGGTYTAQIKREIPIRPEDRRSSLASHYIDWCNVAGPTLLIAAMRCYCCAKLGDEVEVPDELVK